MTTLHAGLGLLVGLLGWGVSTSLAQGVADVPAAKSVSMGADTAARSPYHELLVRAVSERLLLQFTYAGHVRVCEPHAYGVGSEGAAILHTYQVAGGSASKPPPGWRTFTVANIENLVLTQRRFARVRAGFNEERPRLDPAWAEIVPAEEPAEGSDAPVISPAVVTE